VLLEAAGEAILIVDVETSLFVDANEVAQACFGYGLEELKALTLRALSALPSRDHDDFGRRLATDERAEALDVPMIRKDGSQFYADLWVKRYVFAGHAYHLNIIRDTSDRVEREQMLEEARNRLLASEATYRGLVASLDEAVFIGEFETSHFINANPSAIELFGYSLDEWPQLRGRDLHPGNERTTVDAIRRRLRDRGTAHLANVPMRKKDGTVFTAELRLNVYTAAGRKLMVGVARDITTQVDQQAELASSYRDLKDAQAKLLHTQKLAAVGEVAAGVAHEINNPAAYVSMNLDLIAEQVAVVERLVRSLRRAAQGEGGLGRILEEQSGSSFAMTVLGRLAVDLRGLRAMVEDNREGLERIRSVSKDLRVFSRVEQSEVAEVDINAVVRSATNLLHNEVRHRARLSLDLCQLPSVQADRGKLAQVVTNLLINAAHAIDEGQADDNEIRISTRYQQDEIVLVVEDTGTGMTDEVKGRIFDPFFTTKAHGQGTGLGLSLCADIVSKHRGEISVWSKPGEGSRFTVSIPVTAAVAPRSTMRPMERALRGPRRVLVIDDDLAMVRAYKRMLAKHDATVVDNGLAALDAIAETGEPDLIVCDLMMPDMDGLQVYKAIENRWPHLLSRMVFCTGGAFTARARDFVAAIDNVVLDKPLTVAQLDGLLEHSGEQDPSITVRVE